MRTNANAGESGSFGRVVVNSRPKGRVNEQKGKRDRWCNEPANWCGSNDAQIDLLDKDRVTELELNVKRSFDRYSNLTL